MGATASIAGYITAAAGAASAGVQIAGALKGPPKPPPTPLMPDQASLNQTEQLAAAQAAATRNGRASTVLTNNSNTSDLLGP